MWGLETITPVSGKLLSQEVGGTEKKPKNLLANPVLSIRTLTQTKNRVEYTLYGHSGRNLSSQNFSD
jgi:hypothetical protein